MSQGLTYTLNTGAVMPALGLGTFESNNDSDKVAVKTAVKVALETGYRMIDVAYCYGNQKQVGEGLEEVFDSNLVKREDLFICGKLWNTFHRKELVQTGLDLTLEELGVDYLDLFIMHWPVAFQPGPDNYPQDANGEWLIDNVDYIETWLAMEKLLETGKVKAIGVSNFNIPKLERLLKAAHITPAVNQCELHPYLAQNELIRYCEERGIHMMAYSPLGGPKSPRTLDDPLIKVIADKHKRPLAQVMTSWAIQRGTSVIPKSANPERVKANFVHFELPQEDIDALNELGKKHHRRHCDSFDMWGVVTFDDDPKDSGH
ncbi:hypothetical protein BZG36_03056 [Bifiguratus adelaidae]|uniref:NADP-dependent oxidoreductase domain-containing protein n=1 Tax=Bifiguratus adelaidae TaxID=1938954 RepID=A0A261XZG5_9FUNG|nr:hypothetical protein BZG36_03056 [Bifiguratus adelaidae]